MHKEKTIIDKGFNLISDILLKKEALALVKCVHTFCLNDKKANGKLQLHYSVVSATF